MGATDGASSGSPGPLNFAERTVDGGRMIMRGYPNGHRHVRPGSPRRASRSPPGEGLLRTGDHRPRPWRLRRHHDVQRRERDHAPRVLVSERGPAGQRQPHRSDQQELLRPEWPGVGDGFRGAAAEAAVLRAHGRVHERLYRQRDDRRRAAAVHGRLRDGRLHAHSRHHADHGSRLEAGGQRGRRRKSRSDQLRPVAARLRRCRGHHRQGPAHQRDAGDDRRRHAQGVRVSGQRGAVCAALQRVPGARAQ